MKGFKGISSSWISPLISTYLSDDALLLREVVRRKLERESSTSLMFFLASGLQINISKSQVLGVGVPRSSVEAMAASIGCSIMQNKFRYLGVMVGECMSRHKAWDDVVLKLRTRLSKWKAKPYRLVGAEPSEKKISWVAWEKILASKKKGGLGVSSFHALNRALLLKWVWRFVSQDGSLWFRVIQAVYGSTIDTHSIQTASIWSSILREVQVLKANGFDFLSQCSKRIGDGNNTRFWLDILEGR
ncbi:hypothetical protein Tco_0080155 [Tanacetum coccineum]